jgi:hypothetical protein
VTAGEVLFLSPARVPMAVAMLLEPMMLTVVMMRVPPSCQGQFGCDGLVGVMGCV